MNTSKLTSRTVVTERALLQRLRRHYRANGMVLCKSRGTASTDTGDYYALDAYNNFVCEGHIDIEERAREGNVLKPYEDVAYADC
jgi:hypothetical protein